MTSTELTKGKSAKQKPSSNVKDDTTLDSVSQGVLQYTYLLDSADPKAIAVYLGLWKASHAQALANARAIDALNLPVSVSGTRLTVLRTLYFADEKRMPLNEISKATGITPAMVTHLVDGLAKGGLVARLGSRDDRRVRIAQLTTEGESAFHRVLPVISARMTDACVGFTEDEKDTLLSLLQRLY
jgi:DNA-binding MarR family transcriptional regulator